MFKYYFKKLIQLLKKVFIGYTTPRCAGIDISSTAIKMVELVPDTLKINKYMIKLLSKDSVISGVINDIEEVSSVISDSWVKFDSVYEEVAIAIPQSAVIIREINVPLLKNSYQLDEYIKQQLVENLDNEDIDFDYTITDKLENEQVISVVVAKKEKIEEYQAIIQLAGIEVVAIDVENFALQNLFERLLADKPEQHILLIELGATRIKGFVFIGKRSILFNEMIVDYSVLFEDIVAEFGNPNYLRDYKNIYEYVSELLISKKYIDKKLVSAINSDVAKMLQQLRSSALVEQKINIARDTKCYLFGGNTLIPGVANEINRQFTQPIRYATELFDGLNKHVESRNLIRLFTAIALATWGT